MSAPFEREIEGLHDFFVDWYCVELDKAAFSRVESALSPEFERISPDGTIQGRDAVLDGIRSSYDTAIPDRPDACGWDHRTLPVLVICVGVPLARGTGTIVCDSFSAMSDEIS